MVTEMYEKISNLANFLAILDIDSYKNILRMPIPSEDEINLLTDQKSDHLKKLKKLIPYYSEPKALEKDYTEIRKKAIILSIEQVESYKNTATFRTNEDILVMFARYRRESLDSMFDIL